MRYTINEAVKIDNKNGIDFYYYIKQHESEENADDRLFILDSNKQYFNDFLLKEDNRDVEIKSILDVLEKTTLKEMCYIYDYQLFNNFNKLSKFAYGEILTREEIFDTGYVNTFYVNGQLFYALKDDSRVAEEDVDHTYQIENVGFDGDNYTKDSKGKYVMKGTVYEKHEGQITDLNINDYYETEDDFDFTYDADTKEIIITDIDGIFSVNEIDQIKDILLDNLLTNFKGE